MHWTGPNDGEVGGSCRVMARLVSGSVRLLLVASVSLAQIPLFAPVALAVQVTSPDRSAIEGAIKGLKDQVDALPLGGTLTVGEYLTSVHANDFMLTTLRGAQII